MIINSAGPTHSMSDINVGAVKNALCDLPITKIDVLENKYLRYNKILLC